jgi:hypothetical protein
VVPSHTYAHARGKGKRSKGERHLCHPDTLKPPAKDTGMSMSAHQLNGASGAPSSTPQLAARGREAVVKANPLALRRDAAAQVLGISEETFDKHVRPSLPVVRLGSVRVYPVAALERWLLDHADSPVDELERLR